VKVTQEIPLITGFLQQLDREASSGTTSPFTTIQREEVGTILKVTPHINEGNSVAAQNRAVKTPRRAQSSRIRADISTNKRSIKDHRTDRGRGSHRARRPHVGHPSRRAKIAYRDWGPSLCSANLFKSRSGSRQKKNLLVFIRPKILRECGRHPKPPANCNTMILRQPTENP